MPLIPVEPYIFKDAVLTIAGNDYAPHASTIALVPSTTQQTVTWQGLTPDAKFSDTTTPETTWALNLTMAQDHTADSLQTYLNDHAGDVEEIVIQPARGSGLPDYTVTATLVPVQIGGDVNTVQTASASMPVTGEPVRGVAA